jgi:hypothetical protein
MTNQEHGPSEPIRLPPRHKFSFQQTLLLFCALASAGLLFFAVPNLIGGTGIVAWIKALLLALAGMAVAYGVNRLAVERGAPLAVIGYAIAAAASVISIIIVGAGLFMATYSGLVIKSVSQLRLEEHGDALSDYVAARGQVASQSARVVPAIAAVVADLTAKRDCEVRSSCISGSGNGGRGPVARALEERLGRAEAVAGQAAAGAAARMEIAGRLEGLLGRYQAIARASDISLEDKWPQLRGVDAQIRQAVSELGEAIPRSLIAAFAGELAGGIEIPVRADASRQFAAILRGHGGTLRGVVSSIPGGGGPPPTFPSQVGVSDTLAYIGHFAPIAAITGVVELIFPLVLWIYTYLTLRWAAYRIAPPEQRRRHEDDEAVARLFAQASGRAETDVQETTKRRPRGEPRRNGHYDAEH